MSVEPATATVVCESYDATSAKWWYWRAPFIAAEPGDEGYFMEARGFENEDQGKNECSSKNPINLINGNKYKIYTDIDNTIPSGTNRPGFTRYYNSQSTQKNSPMGNKWTHSYDYRMIRQDVLKTSNNIKFSSSGSESDPYQSSIITTRQAACESGIAEIRAQAQGLAPGPYQNLKAFINAEAQWINNQCRIFVDGRYRANFPIRSHGVYQDGGNVWDAYLQFYRPDGNVIRFEKTYSGSAQNLTADWNEVIIAGYELEEIDVTPPPAGGGVIAYQANFVLTDPENVKETYDHTGKLLYIDYPNGVRETLGYQDEQLVRVDNSFGKYIDIQYNVDGAIEYVTDESNRVWEYRYLDSNLIEVVNPDATSVKYHYEDSNFPAGLTGVTDERNIRVSTFEYYPDGLAKSSYLGQPGALPELKIENVDVTYGAVSNTVVNSRGYQSTYYFPGAVLKGLLTQFDGPECSGCTGGSASYDYDLATFNLLGKSEYGQNTLFENHNESGNPGVVTEAVATPEERTTTYTYHPQYKDKVESITGPSVYATGNKVTSYAYDDFGNTTSITINGYRPDGTPVSRSQTFVYNGPLHQLSEINGPRTDVADITTIEYYADDVTEGSNRARMKKVTAPLGVVLYDNITYTPTGKQASYTTGTNLQVVLTYYAGNDRLETQTLTDLSTGKTRATRWTYIANGEVESITQGYGTPEATTLTFEYDDARRLTRVYDGFNNYIEYTLDTEGNVVNENIHDQAGVLLKALNQSFDAYNRLDLSAQENESRNQDFSPDGTLDLETDGKNVVTDYSYDALRRLTSITQDVGGTDPSSANALTQLGYDVQDNLVSVTDPNGGQTSYVYDDLGNLLSMTSPDTGTSSYTHDEAGNIATVTDAKGQVFNYSYDALGRVILADAPGTADDVAYNYDTCVNGSGRLCSVSSDSATVSYAYSAFGDINSIDQVINAYQAFPQSQSQISYTYNATGSLKDIIYPGGSKISYTYDVAGNVYSVILNDGEKNLVTSSQYYPFGPEHQIVRGNGSTIFGHRDQAYRPFDIGNASYFFDVINYDANGNPASFNSSEGSKTHTYDALDRLDTSSGPYGSRDYDYDINGNRTQLNDGAVTSYGYTPDTNRMSQAGSDVIQLDANGNTLAVGDRSYTYTGINRLFEVFDNGSLVSTYAYNGLGQRVAKYKPDGSGQRFIFGKAGKLLAELDLQGNIVKEYVYLEDELLAVIDHTQITQANSAEFALNGVNADVDLLTRVIGLQVNGSPREEVTVLEQDWHDTDLGMFRFINFWGRNAAGVELNGLIWFTDGVLESINISQYVPPVRKGDYNFSAAVGVHTYTGIDPNTGNSATLTVDESTRTITVAEQGWPQVSYTIAEADWITGTAGSFETITFTVTDGGLLINGGITRNETDNFAWLQTREGTAQTDSYQLPAVRVNGAAALMYAHNDHLGTPHMLTDEGGVAVWSAVYDPFGMATVNEDLDGNGNTVTLNIRFPGQYYDAESGLHYNYFRYYDPETGRYITSDPIGLNGGLNTFGYVGGNPIYWADPYGLEAVMRWPTSATIPKPGIGLLPNPVTVAIGSILWSPPAGVGADVPGPNPLFNENANDDGGEGSDAGEGGHCDADTSHDKDRRALNDLINDLTLGGRKPLSSDDADAAIDLAKELGIPGVRDNRNTDHWKGGPHIHIPGTGINHIPARR